MDNPELITHNTLLVKVFWHSEFEFDSHCSKKKSFYWIEIIKIDYFTDHSMFYEKVSILFSQNIIFISCGAELPKYYRKKVYSFYSLGFENSACGRIFTFYETVHFTKLQFIRNVIRNAICCQFSQYT